MAGRERHGPGWRVAQPTQWVAVRLRGDPPAESPSSGVAYADVARHQRLAKPHLPDLLPPVRPHGPDRGDPPRYRERHGRGPRRGKLWRRAVDPARTLHGTRLELAGCIAEPDREHHGPDDAPGAFQRELERHGEGGRVVDRRRDDRLPRARSRRPLPRIGRSVRGARRRDRAHRPEARERRGLRDGLPPRRDPAGGMGRKSGRRFRRPPPGSRRAPRTRQRRGASDRSDGGSERDRRRDLLRRHLRVCGDRPQREGVDDDVGEGVQWLSLGARRRGRVLCRRDRDLRGRRPPSATSSADLVQRIIRTPRRSDDVAVTHELLRRGAVEERAYQVNIARACLERSTLVVLPTGMGKTVVAAMVIAEVLRRKGGKVLFLAPTKPLVEQHAASLRKVLVVDRIALFTGEATSPDERELLWRENKIIVSTPQVIRNDVRAERISLDEVSLVVFDEAHRAVGDYAYVDVAATYKEVPGRLVLGMTASPGSSAEKILKVCGNLGITAVEIRTEYDPDVVPYLHGLEVQRIPVEAPDVSKEIRTLLQVVLEEQVERLKKIGFLVGKPKVSLKDLLAAGDEARKRLDSGVRDGRLYGAMTAQALAMTANHAMALAEAPGPGSLRP